VPATSSIGTVRVDAVLVEEVNGLDSEPLERALDALLDRLRPAVEAGALAGREIEAELRRDHDPVADGGESLADELFVGERAVDLGGVEEGDAAFDRRPDQRDHRLFVAGRAVAGAHRHAAESDGRDLQGVSERSLVHHVSFVVRQRAPQSSIITLIASRSFIAR